MITEVLITGLRGVQEGLLTALGPLVVLVGPNSCGKSTVLDALLIGAGSSPGEAIGRAVRRRSYSWNGARWLFSRHNDERTATIRVTRARAGGEEQRTTLLRWSDSPPLKVTEALSQRGGTEPFCVVAAEITGHARDKAETSVGVAADNSYWSTPIAGGAIRGWDLRLIDSPQGANQALDDVFTAAVERGRKDVAVSALRAVMGADFRDLTLLTDNRVPVVHVEYADGSVPVSLAGDGVASLVRIALELAGRQRGVVLLEEPEAHQHPRLVWQTAAVIWATIQRGIQIILTTHSLDLLDALIATAPAGRLAEMCVFRMKLAAGRLVYSRIPGEDAAAMRADFEDDLR